MPELGLVDVRLGSARLVDSRALLASNPMERRGKAVGSAGNRGLFVFPLFEKRIWHSPLAVYAACFDSVSRQVWPVRSMASITRAR